MARLRNSKTGVVVVVKDETATRLFGFEPVVEPKKTAPKTEK